MHTAKKFYQQLFFSGMSGWSNLLLIVMLMAVCSCANRVSPTGGAKDVAAPQYIGGTPPNYSVHFNARQIIIHFDEFVDLKDAPKHLVVSPIMDPPPEVSVRRRSVVVKLPDNLRENTTYTMNFGEAIVDVHESNAAKNFQYVFSTGSVLDSLMISGKAFHADNLKTEKDILVMLYPDSMKNDSTPYLSLPAYFSKTDSSGNFTVTNISPGSYKIFALHDGDNNYLFNRTDEDIAFLINTIEVPDSNGTELRMFREQPRLLLKKISQVYEGKVVAAFSRPVPDLQVRPLNANEQQPWIVKEMNDLRDTCIFWIKDSISDSLKVVFYAGETVIDTGKVKVKISVEQKKNLSKTPGVRKLGVTNNAGGGLLELGTPLVINMAYPVEEYNLRLITVMKDSVIVPDPEFLFTNDMKMSLKVNIPFKQESRYDILIPPGTFTAYNGLVNDSVRISFKLHEENEYGSISLKLNAPDLGFEYVVLLVDETDTEIRRTYMKPASKAAFEFLHPGKYRLKIIYDGNNNKRWDTGNYLQHLQPERVYYYKDVINVRANWDLETEWMLDR